MNNPWRPPPDPDAVPRTLLGAANQRARCERGEHDATVAEKGRVTYLAHGKRVEPGTRYCRFCSVILADQEPAPETAGEEER